ncbi:MAG: hypothetical protein CME57_06555 [Halieaceae bacterium]|nr:hypothetical protein [Halieaceae bacterium]
MARAMIYFRIFTILLATSFMAVVFYGDLTTVTALLAGLCGGFVAVVAAQNDAAVKFKTLEKRLQQLETKLAQNTK